MTLIDRHHAARQLGISPRTLEKWAVTGDGPPFYKLGGRVLYAPHDIQDWLSSQRRNSTSQQVGEGSSHA